jgi:hypothetical protein
MGKEKTNLLSVYIRPIRPIRDEKDTPRFDIDPIGFYSRRLSLSISTNAWTRVVS